MLTSTVSRFFRKLMRALGFKTNRDRVPTYQGLNVAVDSDFHVQRVAAVRYVSGMEQRCEIDEDSCEYWAQTVQANTWDRDIVG